MSGRRTRFRWFVALGALSAGVALAALELRDPAGSAFEQWFWLATAGIVAGLGAIELIALLRGTAGEDDPRL